MRVEVLPVRVLCSHGAGFGEYGAHDGCGEGERIGLAGRHMALMVLLEAGHDAQVGLALGTVVLGLAAQYPAVRVDCVPAVIAAKRWT